jgi:hypothetical protein
MNWDMDLNTVPFLDHPRRSEDVRGNLFFVDVEFPKAGVPLFPHTHPYDHVTRAVVGRVAVKCGDKIHMLDASNPFNRSCVVPKDVAHSAIGLDDGACMTCTHILRADDGTMFPFEYKLTTAEIMAATGRA